MKRWLFSPFAAISLVLCGATLALFVRSMWCTNDRIARNHEGPVATAQWQIVSLEFWSNKGRFSVCRQETRWIPSPYPGQPASEKIWSRATNQQKNEPWYFGGPRGTLGKLGFRLDRMKFTDPQGNTIMGRPTTITHDDFDFDIPQWFVALILAVFPALWFGAFVKRRSRAASGRCANCGYDLRASPDRCPECGMEATPKLAKGELA